MFRFRIIFSLLLIFGSSVSVFSQRQADLTVDVNAKTQQIILHDQTGVAIVQTEKAYIGLNPDKEGIAWMADRAGEVSSKLEMVETGTDFYNMTGTPYVLIRNSLLDSRNGKVIIDRAKEDFKRVNDYEVIPQLNAVLVRTTADKMLRLYLVSMADNQLKWKVDVLKPGVTLGGAEGDENIDVPTGTTMISKSGHLIYQNKKNIACIDGKTGALLWVQKADPAEVFFSPDQKNVLVNEAAGGGVMAMAAAGSGIKLRSKTVLAFDLLTGKEAWKDPLEAEEKIQWADAHPDYLTLVHRKGCNLYDYATGKPLWKKDFEGRRVEEIQPNAEGFLVTFQSGYKSMQLDKTGKELWKKPQTVETDDGDDDDLPEEGGLDRYKYTKGELFVTATQAWFKPKKGAGMKRWTMSLEPEMRIAFDASRMNLIVLTNKALHIINPDNNPKVSLVTKVDIESAAEFHTLELREHAYFLSSQQEYLIFDPETSKLSHKFYKKPFDSKGMMLGMAKAGLAIGSASMAMSGVANAGVGGSKAVGSTVGMQPPGSGNTEIRRANRQMGAANAMNDASTLMPPTRFEAFKQTRDFSYYLSKDKAADAIVLFKVNKDTGAEADKLIFDDARPNYVIDDVQKRVYYANKNSVKIWKM